jgi:hypothetical protein
VNGFFLPARGLPHETGFVRLDDFRMTCAISQRTFRKIFILGEKQYKALLHHAGLIFMESPTVEQREVILAISGVGCGTYFAI